MKQIAIITSFALLVLSIYFSFNIYVYLVLNDWSFLIPDLGSSQIGRILMGVHFIFGLSCMFGYCSQLITSYLVSIKLFYWWHKINGVYVHISAVITGLCGMIYVIVHGTIGGIVMDLGFFIFGLLFTLCPIASICIIWHQKYFNQYHLVMTNLFAALIFSSLFYRVQYMTAKFVGYPIPNNTHTDLYTRPLDRIFQFSFFLVPLLAVIIYHLTYKNESIRIFLQIMNTVIWFTIVGIVSANLFSQ